MYKTVIVGPQLLHSEENITSLSSTSDNLHPPHPSVFDNILTKKTRCCLPTRLPAWSPTFPNCSMSTFQAPRLMTSHWPGVICSNLYTWAKSFGNGIPVYDFRHQQSPHIQTFMIIISLGSHCPRLASLNVRGTTTSQRGLALLSKR